MKRKLIKSKHKQVMISKMKTKKENIRKKRKRSQLMELKS
jgi:hypothetical protein